MKVSEFVQVGMTNEGDFLVEERHTATKAGSGGVHVLATPWMIAFMEQVSYRLLAKYLPDGYSSVGVLVNVRHLAPTPVSKVVRARSEVLAVDGWQVVFSVQAWDETEQVGEGQHQRIVILEERFLSRVEKKANT